MVVLLVRVYFAVIFIVAFPFSQLDVAEHSLMGSSFSFWVLLIRSFSFLRKHILYGSHFCCLQLIREA